MFLKNMSHWGILGEKVATSGSNFQKIENLGLATFNVKFRSLAMVSDHILWPSKNCSFHVDIKTAKIIENRIVAGT